MNQVQELYQIMGRDPLAAQYMQAEMRFSLMMNDVYKILADNTGHTFEDMEKLCDRNNWFIGQEAVELGIADKVLISPKNK